MTESSGDRNQKGTAEVVGGLDAAPTTETGEKSEPEAGTGSADKRSEESLAEQDEQPATMATRPGATGGDVTA